MEKLNKFLTQNIYNINKCLIHYGDYYYNDKEVIFNKKISKEKFDNLISKFVSNKYSVKKMLVYNYKNYFLYAYKKQDLRKYKKSVSTLKRQLKNYKD